MNSNLKKEFEYYLDNKDRLVKLYDGKYIVIKNCVVIGTYDDEIKAIKETSKTQELGTFLVQKCEPGNSQHTMTFHSRAYCR